MKIKSYVNGEYIEQDYVEDEKAKAEYEHEQSLLPIPVPTLEERVAFESAYRRGVNEA